MGRGYRQRHSPEPGRASRIVPQYILGMAVEVRAPDPGADLDTAVEVLDEWAGTLVRARHAAEVGDLKIAHYFRECEGHEVISRCKQPDHIRERWDMGIRTFHSRASVGRLLATCPAIAAAYETVGFSKAEDLARVATPENEHEWLPLAWTLSGRALRRRVRQACEDGDHDNGAPLDIDETTIDGEPAFDITISGPRVLRTMARALREYASRMEGARVPFWKVIADVCGETAYGPGIGDEPVEPARSIRGVRVRPADERTPRTSPEPEEPALEPPEIWKALVTAGERPRVPKELEALLSGIARCNAHELEERHRQLMDWTTALEYELAVVLSGLRSGGAAGRGSFENFDDYVSDRLGLSPSHARQLIRVASHYWMNEEVNAAWATGRVKAHRLDRLRDVIPADATPAHSTAWLERAQTRTCKQLDREIDWACGVAERTGVGDVAPPESGIRLDRPGDGEDAAALSQALRQMSAQTPVHPAGTLRVCAPASVAELFVDTLAKWTARGEPAWIGFMRMAASALREWKNQPGHANPAFEEYGWECAMPWCTRRVGLHDHHVIFRSRGGGNELSNQAVVCHRCHAAIHDGIHRVTGRGPDRLTWAIGCRPGKPPVAIVRGYGVIARAELW